jgi:hypothetical protein
MRKQCDADPYSSNLGVQFADGTTWDTAMLPILPTAIKGNAAGNTLYGTNGDDVTFDDRYVRYLNSWRWRDGEWRNIGPARNDAAFEMRRNG